MSNKPGGGYKATATRSKENIQCMFYNFKAIPQRMALKLVDTDSAENRITNSGKAENGVIGEFEGIY